MQGTANSNSKGKTFSCFLFGSFSLGELLHFRVETNLLTRLEMSSFALYHTILNGEFFRTNFCPTEF